MPSESSSTDCDHSTCGWKPRYYGPDGECLHPNKQYTGSLYDGPGGRKTWLYYSCPDCKSRWQEEEAKCPPACAEAHTYSGSCVFRADGPCDCSSAGAERHADYCRTQRDSCPHCGSEDHKWAQCALSEQTVKAEAPPLTPEEEKEADIESWPCGDCGTTVPGGLDWCPEPDCQDRAREKLAREAPPQPKRHPPRLIAYSVQGHLYEVALPGDATVVAQDGALIITHSLGPVAGIVQARPLEGEQS